MFSATKQIASNCGTPYTRVGVPLRVCVCALGKSAQSARVAATIKKPFGFVGAGKYATKCGVKGTHSVGCLARLPAVNVSQRGRRERRRERDCDIEREGRLKERSLQFESHLAAK